jgi:glutaminyl-tRNA synthetase
VEEADALSRDLATAVMFDAALGGGASAASVASWMIHELPREIGGRTLENLPFSGRELGELVALVEDGTLSTTAARRVLAHMVEQGGEPRELVEALNLRQVSDAAALMPAVEAVIAANAGKAEEYRGGKVGLLGLFVGLVMRQTGGQANPEVVKSLLEEKLGS